MNAVIFPSDLSMCGLIRMKWIGDTLSRQGRTATVMPRSPKIAIDNSFKPPKVVGVNPGNFDVVVFQRAASYQMSEVIEILQYNGKTVVLDIDDDLSCIHPRNPAFKVYDPTQNHKTNWMHADKAYAKADLVTCTTEALAERYASHGRVAILPNYIPESYLRIVKPVNEVPIVGYAGWTKTHPEDLIVTKGMIDQVIVETGAKFLALGDQDIFLNLQVRPNPQRTIYHNFVSIAEYPTYLGKMDIGLVPLKDCPFNRAKSWLKALEYASVGVVPVVSPTPDNMKLVELGGAIAAENPKAWYEKVKELIEDKEYLAEMSKKCREIASEITIEKNAGRWWDAWSKAYNKN